MGMTAPLVLLMVVLVSGVLLGCLFLFGRRAAAGRAASAGQSGDSGWMAAVMTDGGGSDCSAGDAGCGDGGGGGGGD
jgi:hypothetical protein